MCSMWEKMMLKARTVPYLPATKGAGTAEIILPPDNKRVAWLMWGNFLPGVSVNEWFLGFDTAEGPFGTLVAANKMPMIYTTSQAYIEMSWIRHGALVQSQVTLVQNVVIPIYITALVLPCSTDDFCDLYMK